MPTIGAEWRKHAVAYYVPKNLNFWYELTASYKRHHHFVDVHQLHVCAFGRFRLRETSVGSLVYYTCGMNKVAGTSSKRRTL